MRFRKKPVVIEAVGVSEAMNGAARNWTSLPKWLSDAYDKGDIVFAADCVVIRTLEGMHKGMPGDWIIQGVRGELYPCKPDIFAATYEAVTE